MGASAPITQIITYAVPAGGLPDCVNDGLELIRGADGFKGSCNGQLADDLSIGFWIFQWESAAKRDAFLADPAHASVFVVIKALVSALTEEGARVASQLQVIFTSPASAEEGLSAPNTEIAVSTLKPDADADEYERLLDRVVAAFADVGGAKGAAWGKAVQRADPESRRNYVLVVGWESAEAYRQSKENQSGHELHEQICALAEYESKLAKLEVREKRID